MVTKRSAKTGHSATPKDGGLYPISATAYRYALRAEGASVRDAAAWMKVSPTVVQRLLKRGERITAIKSRRIRRHYLACVQRLVKAEDRRRNPPGYVAGRGRHGVKVVRSRVGRKAARPSRQKSQRRTKGVR